MSKYLDVMQIFEVIIVIILLACIIARMIPRLGKNRGILYMPILAALLIGAQVTIFGYRWQMLPLIMIIPLLFFVNLIQYNYRSKHNFLLKRRLFRIAGNVFLSFMFLFSAIFPLLLPVKNLLPPDGPYPVGKTNLVIEEKEREEIFTRDPNDHRRILLSFWYPAEGALNFPRESYWDKEKKTGRAFSQSAEIYPFWYTHLSLVKTNAYPDAPCSSRQETFPVILYSHSYYGLNTENTMLMEMLASHGYIVCSIAHSYENVLSLFPEGEAVTGDLEYISTLYNSHGDKEERLYSELKNAGRKEQKIALVKDILQVDDLSTKLLKERTRDVEFTVNKLTLINRKNGVLHQKMDLDRIGILGWSFGGATALEACLADQRIKAGINMDGLPYGEKFNSGLPIRQPFMFVYSETQDEMDQISAGLMFDQVVDSAYHLNIKGAEHSNFSDLPLFFKIMERLGYWGSIPPNRMLELEEAYIKGFFDRYVEGEHKSFPEGPSTGYPEVSLQRK